ncbi:MAG TPA: DnaJ domain-containing protein [Isosphaeraceae bacterium]|nr:DnaJ domain-containing protein [Isosphaeraceae bacterium]
MSDPHDVLGLTPDAGETEIRQRYLELVRAFPPERAPERFAAVHTAYEALRDPAKRLHAQLFTIETHNDSFEALAVDLHRRLREVRLPVKTLLALADAP